jgi:hypothetical protein
MEERNIPPHLKESEPEMRLISEKDSSAMQVSHGTVI